MKNKIILSILLLSAVMFTSCENTGCRQQTKVHCYKQQDDNGAWFWYYVLFMNNHPYYYYQSPTQVSNFNNIQWATSSGNFNPTIAQEQPIEYIESSGFSQDMQQTFQESNGFEMQSDYTESSGFSNDNTSPDNSSSGSESGGFDSGGDGGSSSGGDSGGGDSGGGSESGGFE